MDYTSIFINDLKYNIKSDEEDEEDYYIINVCNNIIDKYVKESSIRTTLNRFIIIYEEPNTDDNIKLFAKLSYFITLLRFSKQIGNKKMVEHSVKNINNILIKINNEN